jgi:hypothetical protein
VPPDILNEIVTGGSTHPFCCSPADNWAKITDQFACGSPVALQDPCQEGDVFGNVSISVRHNGFRISTAFTI